MKNTSEHMVYSGWQIFTLTLLRVLIGWHFMHEGFVKIYTPWSAKSYLDGAIRPLASFFRNFHEDVLHIVNTMSIGGLILTGL